MTLVRDALAALGVTQLVLAVHDRALPARPEDDLGCGTPGGDGAVDLLDAIAALGFTGLQLGPPGEIDPGNLSPYDGTSFARSRLNLSFGALAADPLTAPLFDEAALAREVGPRAVANRCDFARAFPAGARLFAALHARWDALAEKNHPAAAALDDATNRFAVGSAAWPSPPAGRRALREQWLLHAQHAAFRSRANARGLALFADLQAGLSVADRAGLTGLLLPGYAMGAPPSRTNPAGQPWGYPVPDPRQWGTLEAPGPSLRLWQARFDKVFSEYDGLRVDHPHALVCPWLYRTETSDAYAAVRAGARLFSAGGASPHHELAAIDIVRDDQLATALAPWTDEWVRSLEPPQVARYATVFDLLVRRAEAAGVPRERLLCEVLSTRPAPLGAVMGRHGLGRFRVTSKADVDDPTDVYLHGNARPEDWIMVGTHDTPPIWAMAESWSEERTMARAAYAARRLSPHDAGRAERLRARFATRRDALAAVELALLFTSRARNVMIFVSDWIGERETYNHPGEVRDDNWTLCVPAGFAALQRERSARGCAFDLPWALALALEARPERAVHRSLIDALRADSCYPAADD